MNIKKTVFPLLLIVAAVLIFYLFTKPIYAEIGDLQKKKAEYEAAIENTNTLLTKLERLKKEYNAFSPRQLARLENILPGGVEKIQFVLLLSRIAEENDMSISNVSITMGGKSSESQTASQAQAPQNSGNTNTNTTQSKEVEPSIEARSITVDFQTSGDYGDLLAFIRDLEKSQRLIEIEKLQFKGEESSKSDGVYDYSVKVKAFWLNY